jgi:hypothetical protein
VDERQGAYFLDITGEQCSLYVAEKGLAFGPGDERRKKILNDLGRGSRGERRQRKEAEVRER